MLALLAMLHINIKRYAGGKEESIINFSSLHTTTSSGREAAHMFEGYIITDELASTAVSRVLLGESLSLTAPRQRVVIKWFLATYLTTQREKEHFRQEVITHSRLLHPFILPVFSAGFVENTPYIVEAYA